MQPKPNASAHRKLVAQYPEGISRTKRIGIVETDSQFTTMIRGAHTRAFADERHQRIPRQINNLTAIADSYFVRVTALSRNFCQLRADQNTNRE